MSPISPPNYVELVRFLVTPFLEFPDALTVDFESYAGQHRVLMRMAFADSDKGRVFGRGGRTLQAVRAIVDAAAQLAGQTASLEVFGERESRESAEAVPALRTSPSSAPKPRPKKREQNVSVEESGS